MCYDGCYQYSYPYPYAYGDCGQCQIYPVPFMPVNPLYAHAYVPYQSSSNTFPMDEALMQGTIFPELTNLYNPSANYWKEES
ncbi:hypothetical protein Clos_0901 [Alkaliphilus oremlandii OhILAs]|uniref:Spore coat associated protein JA (CotJA) n=2 Tax=Alkaliphilus oremlandii TaxID=461876 RepID=A8MEW9_ALKOO|nr:hypothetical protein Clos_0901 [Alkaliphilus oremlandii OhILAs]